MDLTMPKELKKVCHECRNKVSLHGYQHQNCPECGKEIMVLKGIKVTVPYIAPTGLNVLSLFDGASCGRVALERANIPVKNYFACEIDQYAMEISKKNYPEIKQLGDVKFISKYMFPNHKIDLLIGGSPCQSFSKAGDGSGFDGSSQLFWEYVRILKEVKPTYFLLENVSMKKEWEDIITDAIGVKPIKINSGKLSAQNRKRLYWTNIPSVGQPEDKGLCLSDILLDNKDVEEKFYLSDKAIRYMDRVRDVKRNKSRWEHHQNPLDGKSACLTANMYKGVPYGVVKFDRCEQIATVNIKGHDQIKRVYSENAKSPTINACTGGNHQPKVLDRERQIARKLTPLECERLQTLPDNYTEGVSNTQRYKMIGNGWTIDVIAHIFKNIDI